MAKFARYLAALSHDAPQQWQGKFLRYKELKKALKRCRGPPPEPYADSSGGAPAVLPELEDAFFAMLGKQLEDANRYFEAGSSKVMSEYLSLQTRQRLLRCLPCLARPRPQRVAALAQSAYWCVRFARANSVALRKILKKHDKQCANARGRIFLQECWESSASGGGLGFLHSPLLDELRAVQDVLREQLHSTMATDEEDRDDDCGTLKADLSLHPSGPKQPPKAERAATAQAARATPPAPQPGAAPARGAEPSAATGAAGQEQAEASPARQPSVEQAEPACCLTSWLETHQPDTGRPPRDGGGGGAAARAPIAQPRAGAADVPAGSQGTSGSPLGSPAALLDSESDSSTQRPRSSLDELSSSWTDQSGTAFGYCTPSARRQWRRGLTAIAESPDCLLDSSDIDWADSAAADAGARASAAGGSSFGGAEPPAAAAAAPPRPGDATPAGGSLAANAPPPPGDAKGARPAGPPSLEGSHRRLCDDDLRCPICLDLLFKPVGLGCGHKFCRNCVLEAAGFGGISGATRNIASHIPRRAACPQCRQPGVYRAMLRLREMGRLIQSRYPEEYAERAVEEQRHVEVMVTKYMKSLPWAASRMYIA